MVEQLEKEVATNCSILAWEIRWTEEPGMLQSMELQESDTIEWLNHHHQAYVTLFYIFQVSCKYVITPS